ncbi:transcription repressor OFP1-like [Musa acuminata AAA Group]|uniref:transcription repressor OFP1-like n=1 Tax=Musa acuminata AAA Group TaxID=214697 RepID=UPI0031D6D104
MGWRRNQHHQQQQEQERRKQEENKTKKTKKKKKKKKKLNSTSSSFSFSSVLPFSWLAKLKPKRRTAPVVVPPGAVFTPPPSPSPPDPQLDPLAYCSAAPGRLSVGEDGGGSRPRITPAAARQRSARHHSVGDLEITLGHIIPFSRRSTRRWVESDSGSDASGCDLGLGRRPPRPRRSTRTTVVYTSDQRVDTDGRDGLPRRSFGGKIQHRAKVRVRSPRAAAAKAEVERMKAAARRAEGKRKGLERFAVVKCSRDPQRDFRESMVEMIRQKGIGRPEEMERLLACYLSLNSDEHHDVIVKVFRQVSFELSQSPIDGIDGSSDQC